MQLIGLLIVGALLYAVVAAFVHLLALIWPLIVTGVALWIIWKVVDAWAERQAMRRYAEAKRAKELVS